MYLLKSLNISRSFLRALRYDAMVGQTKISSFFTNKITMNKRASESEDLGQGDGKSTPKCTKKLKQSDDSGTPPLLNQIEPNPLKTKIIKASRSAPALHSNIGTTWFKALEAEFSKEYFLKLSTFLEQERKKNVVFPPEEKVFSWTHFCDIENVKVVILGQDPYHGPNQAHGLAFSVTKGIHPPPSLVNMFRELKDSVPGFEIPSHGDLSGWASQGVLLLNACLTVKAHSANSHKDQGWEMFTDAVINWISKNRQGVVFLLWGAYAQKKAAMISKSVHHVLSCPHPSPLSAHRGFLGCRHFVKANDYLKAAGKEIIDWTL